MTAAVEQARKRWLELVRGRLTRRGLIEVHSVNKYLLLAHSPVHYRRLGRIVAAPRSVTIEELVMQYQSELEAALAMPLTVGKHVNVLQHLLGYFKHRLAAPHRAEIMAAIESYRQGRVPLEQPAALILQHVRALQIDYLLAQTYLGAA